MIDDSKCSITTMTSIQKLPPSDYIISMGRFSKPPAREATESILKSTTSKSSRVNPLRDPPTKSILLDLADPLVPVPPDGGWGWVVVAVGTLMMFCIDGVNYCFSIFFDDIIKDLQCDITQIATVTSICGGFYYIIGPITCSILNRVGFQLTAIVGGGLAAVAFLSASFMTSIVPFTVVIGCLAGVAFNLMYAPTIIAIGFYFEKWRAVAMAICCCGSSLGMMSFPLVMEHPLRNLTWRSKFQIISGVMALCGFLGLVYKPIKTTRVEKNVQFQLSQDYSMSTLSNESEVKPGTGVSSLFQRFRNVLFPTISEVSVQMENRHGSKSSSLGYGYFLNKTSSDDYDDTVSTYIQPYSDEPDETLTVQDSIRHSVTEKRTVRWYNCRNRCSKWHCCHCCARHAELSTTNINRPLYRDDIFYSGSVYRLSQYSNVHPASSKGVSSLAYTLSVTRAPTQRDLNQQTKCVCCPEAVLRVLATMLNFQMLKSPTFIILLLSGYLSLMGTYVVFIYLPRYAISRGIDNRSSALLLSVIGVSNTVGRAVCGLISCKPNLDMNIVSYITISISGAAIIYSAFITTEFQFIIVCVVFGFALASFAVLRALVFVEMFGLENLTNCFGLNMLFQSLASFTATPLVSIIHNNTGSFPIVFAFTGSALLFSGLMLVPLKFVLKWENRRKKKVTFTTN